ncbi:MAG: hypothetical protein NT066_06865, partial [Candidatus Omnitrophica bacterium]|nr:hypothetical protein [Candidatus Omnitrophota bacterium]
MTNAQKPRNKNTGLQPSRATRDLVLLIAITILVLILSYFFDVFILIVKFLQEHPNKIIYIDEVITGLLTLSIGLAIFAWRRWLELKKETAERIKKQEELIRLAATQAEVERIISKQLRSDMDQMKQDVREILHLFIN